MRPDFAADETQHDRTPVNIVFAGTPEFAVPPLVRLLEDHYRPIAVYTQPDRPAGRGRRLTASPVKRLAVAQDLTLAQPETLRDPTEVERLKDLEPDLIVVVAYGLILPVEVLQIPRYGCWNIHASLLPRWRGAAPIHRAIEAGDSETGVCIMQMDEGLDTGPVLYRQTMDIRPDDTCGSLHDRLADAGAGALLHCRWRVTLEQRLVARPLLLRVRQRHGIEQCPRVGMRRIAV